MALVNGSVSNYVKRDYVAVGYVRRDMVVSASTTIAGYIVTYTTGVVSLSSNFSTTTVAGTQITAELDASVTTTYSCTIFGQLTTDIILDLTLTQVTDPGLLIGADLPVGLITNWSALGSPLLGTSVNAQSTFSTSISAVVDTGEILGSASLTTEFSQDTTASNLITLGGETYDWSDNDNWDDWSQWQNTWMLETEFSTTTSANRIVHGELDVDSALTWDASIVGTRVGDIDCTTTASMSTTPALTKATDVSLSTAFSTTIGSSITRYAEVDLTSEFTESVSGLTIISSSVSMSSAFTATTAGGVILGTGGTINTAFGFSGVGGVVKYASASLDTAFTLSGTPTTYFIDKTRYIIIPAETRIINLAEEDRTLEIKQETRNLVIPINLKVAA